MDLRVRVEAPATMLRKGGGQCIRDVRGHCRGLSSKKPDSFEGFFPPHRPLYCPQKSAAPAAYPLRLLMRADFRKSAAPTAYPLWLLMRADFRLSRRVCHVHWDRLLVCHVWVATAAAPPPLPGPGRTATAAAPALCLPPLWHFLHGCHLL